MALIPIIMGLVIGPKVLKLLDTNLIKFLTLKIVTHMERFTVRQRGKLGESALAN
jgi:hypothetical protein